MSDATEAMRPGWGLTHKDVPLLDLLKHIFRCALVPGNSCIYGLHKSACGRVT